MRKTAVLLFLAVLAVGAQTSSAVFPDAPVAGASTIPSSTTVPSTLNSLPDQKVGPGDLIAISVADVPELSRNFRVSSDGTLALPLLSARIPAAGKEPAEIEMEISGALVKEQVLVRPVVSASVVEYRSVPVSVTGAVRHPITFQAVGNTTLLDALNRAEGLTADAGAEILVSRARTTPDGDPTLLQRIPVRALMDEADPALNLRLYGGEEIRVPPAGRVYVVGNVKKSGVYPMQGGNDTSVLTLIALSEGLLPFSNKEAFIYRKEGGKNDRDEIPIQLAKIMDRKSPDVHLQPNDILYIPDNKGRKLAANTIDRIVTFGAATGSGILVWR